MNGVLNECYVEHLMDPGLPEHKEGQAGSVPRYVRVGAQLAGWRRPTLTLIDVGTRSRKLVHPEDSGCV